MITLKRLAGRGSAFAIALAFGVAVVVPALTSSGKVYAAGQFSPRKLTMNSQASGNVSTDVNGTAYNPGDGGNGAKTYHTFNFTAATSGATLQSVLIEYCTTPFFGTTCTAPTGMDASNISSVTTTNFAATAPTVDAATAGNAGSGGIFAANAGAEACTGGGSPYRTNCILLKRASPTAESGTPAFQVVAGSSGSNYIKNPTSLGTFYVRISTFSDAYTTIVDQGAVAGSVNDTIDITAKVQEKLNFSVGNATSITVPGASCTALTSGNTAVALGDGNGVLDPTTAYFAHSYWRISTNAPNGTIVQYSGDTLKTVGNTANIAAIGGTAAASSPGSAQFGLTVDSADATSNGYSLSTLAPTTQYNSTTAYAFDTGSKSAPVSLASQGGSPNIISCETGSVKYVANIPTTQKAGIYKTSVAYIAVPTF